MAQRNWTDMWNSVIRDVIFKDEKLKRLMMIPEDTNILAFTERYFIRAGYTGEIVRDENVRIVYGIIHSESTAVPNIRRNELCFDIYVKDKVQRNADRDRLALRTELIKNRLVELLTGQRYVKGFRFWISGEGDMGTRAVGYARYNVSFQYMKVY